MNVIYSIRALSRYETEACSRGKHHLQVAKSRQVGEYRAGQRGEFIVRQMPVSETVLSQGNQRTSGY